MLKQRQIDGGTLTHPKVVGYCLYRKDGTQSQKPEKSDCSAVVVLQSDGTLGAVPVDHILNWAELPSQIHAKV